MRLPDRWDHRCPKIEELDRSELIEFLTVGITEGKDDFDKEFCRSLVDRLKRTSLITNNQYNVIVRLLPRLWDNDPELWRPIDEHDYSPDPDPDFCAVDQEATGPDDPEGDSGRP